jgi:hypothetical protein
MKYDNESKESIDENELERILEEIDVNVKGGDNDNEKVNNKTRINPLVEDELFAILNRFFNEIDLVFDYIDRDIVHKLNRYLKSLSNINNVEIFVTETTDILKKYGDSITKIVTTKRKLKTSDFDFMNDIVLFQGILDFSNFKQENKNTKRSLVKYLYNIYMSVFILNFSLQSNGNIDVFTQQMTDFVKDIQERQKKEEQERQIKEQEKQKKLERLPQQIRPTNILMNSTVNSIPQMPAGMGDFGNLLGTLMQNDEIMSLATDLSKDIQGENLDPMLLLSSIMSGKPDDRVQSLISNISSKIETKINNGQIDKEILEKQAQNIMNSVGKSGDFANMFTNLD